MPFEDRVGRILDHVARRRLLDDRAGPVGAVRVQQLLGAGSVRNLLVQTRPGWHLAGGDDVGGVATTAAVVAATRLLTTRRRRDIAV